MCTSCHWKWVPCLILHLQCLAQGWGMSIMVKGASLLVGECLANWGNKDRAVGWYSGWEADTGRWESNSIYQCVESGVHTGVRHLV